MGPDRPAGRRHPPPRGLARGPSGSHRRHPLEDPARRPLAWPSTSVSVAGSLIGTLTYVSPEQAQGHALDERSDLYSVGVVLHELLTRRAPFSGRHLDLLNAHVSAAPPSMREVAPLAGIPASIEAVVLRALEKAPDERFAAAEVFAEALADTAHAELS